MQIEEVTVENIGSSDDLKSRKRVQGYGVLGREYIDDHLDRLANEIDVEKATVIATSGLVIGGTLLGLVKNKLWLSVPILTGAMLIQHALTGGSGLTGILKRLGYRSVREIERERYALKALRGDFAGSMGNAGKSWQGTEP